MAELRTQIPLFLHVVDVGSCDPQRPTGLEEVTAAIPMQSCDKEAADYASRVMCPAEHQAERCLILAKCCKAVHSWQPCSRGIFRWHTMRATKSHRFGQRRVVISVVILSK